MNLRIQDLVNGDNCRIRIGCWHGNLWWTDGAAAFKGPCPADFRKRLEPAEIPDALMERAFGEDFGPSYCVHVIPDVELDTRFDDGWGIQSAYARYAASLCPNNRVFSWRHRKDPSITAVQAFADDERIATIMPLGTLRPQHDKVLTEVRLRLSSLRITANHIGDLLSSGGTWKHIESPIAEMRKEWARLLRLIRKGSANTNRNQETTV